MVSRITAKKIGLAIKRLRFVLIWSILGNAYPLKDALKAGKAIEEAYMK